MRYSVRSIVAVRIDREWSELCSAPLGDIDLSPAELGNHGRLLHRLRTAGFLSGRTKGRVRVIEKAERIEIRDKNTFKPLLALSPVC